MATGRGKNDDEYISDVDTSESDYDVDSDAESVCSTTSTHSQMGQSSFKVFVSYPHSVSRENIKDHLRICGLLDNVKRLNMFYANKESKGCGYIEFVSPDTGRRAVTTLKQSLLLGKHKMDAKEYTGRTRKQLQQKSTKKRRKSSASARPEEKGERCKVFVGAGKGNRLPNTIKATHLKEHLAAVKSTILDVVIANDPQTKEPKGYGFVFFNSRHNADVAIKKYTRSVLHDCMLRLEISTSVGDHKESPPPPEPSVTKLFVGALVDKQLPSTIESFHLEAHFWKFKSSLHEAVIVKDPDTEQSKGYGFAHFKSKQAAEAAIKEFSGSILHGCQLKLDLARTKEDHTNGGCSSQASGRLPKQHEFSTHLPEPSGRRVYIGAQGGGRLPSSVQNIHLKAHFWQFKQTLEEAFVVNDVVTKQPRGFGFAVFKSKRAAETAVKKLDGSVLHGCQLKLELAKVKGECDKIPVPKSQAKGVATIPKVPLPVASLPKDAEYKVFVGGLRPSVDTKHIQEHFKAFQSDIKNVYQYIPGGGKQAKKHGFVVFSSYEAAEKAISSLNGTQLHGGKIRVQHHIKRASNPPPTSLKQPVPQEVLTTKPSTSKTPKSSCILDTSVPLQLVSPLPPIPQPSNEVLISNLSPMIDESILKTLCKGIVSCVKFIPVNSDSKNAIITFTSASDAQSAVAELNGKRFFGQDLLASLQPKPELVPQPVPKSVYQPVPRFVPAQSEEAVGILVDLTSSTPDIEKLLQLSPSQWNLLTAIGPEVSNLFQELVQPFKTNPNVKIKLLLAEVAVRFTGQMEAVESAYTHIESQLNRSISVKLEFVKTLMEIRPDFTQQMTVSYGVSVMGIHDMSTLLKLDGRASGISSVRELINKLIADFQLSVVRAQLPLTNNLIASAKKRFKVENISVRLSFTSSSPQEVVVYSLSSDHHQKAVKVLSSKLAVKFVPFHGSHTQKQVPLVGIEVEFSVYAAIAEEEGKIYIKGFVKQDVVAAQEKLMALVSECSVQFAALDCTTEQKLYLKQKLKFQKETVLKVFAELPAQVLNEPSRALCFKGSLKDIELSQRKLLEGPLLGGLLHRTFTFMAQDKFFHQLEKYVLRPLKKERSDFEYVKAGQESQQGRGRRASEKGEESEFSVTVFSQTPEIYEEAVSLLEDITPCSKTLNLLHPSAMDCVQKDFEEKEKKYRVRVVVPKDSTTQLIIFGLTEREAAQCYNDLNDTIESTITAGKYVRIDYNQLKYFQQKKAEELKELSEMCQVFKVLDKQKQEKETALIRIDGTIRQVRATCKRLNDMRELDFFSKSFTVSIEKRYNKMWLKFWQAYIREREESHDLIVNLEPPKKLLGSRATASAEYGVEYEFAVCGGDESATNDVAEALSNTESIQRVLTASDVGLGELDRGRKEKKLEIEQYFVNVYLDVKNTKVVLTAPASCKEELEAVEGEIEQFISQRAIEDREIAVTDPVLSLMLYSKSKSHITFANKFSKPHGVTVQCLRHPKCGLRLRGNKEAIDHAEPIIRKEIIEEMKATIGEIKFPINSSLLPFFDTPDFGHFRDKIRDELSVLCTFPKAREENKVIQSVFLKTSSPEICIKLEICQGDITNEEVDAIVNAANEDLQHVGGLAKAIAIAGGESIQRESDEYIQKHGKLKPGEVVCLGAGDLSCKSVVHAVGPRWVDGRSFEEQTLYFTVLRCLQMCCTKSIESVAIPALSTGIFSVPDYVCIQASLKAVRDFCQVATTSSLTTIRFVLLHSAVAQRFSLALDSDVMIGCVLPTLEPQSPPAMVQSPCGVHTWEWMADDGSFVPYQQDIDTKLNNAYSKDPKGAISFTIGRFNYIVNLSKMLQINLQTAKERTIRQAVASTPSSPFSASSHFFLSSSSSSSYTSSSSPSTVQWKYVNDDRRWTPYSPDDSQAIEAMFQRSTPGERTIKGRVYTFDFTLYYQINVDTGGKRQIKRSAVNLISKANVPEVKIEKKVRTTMVTLRGPRANLTVAKSRIDEKLEGALTNGNVSFPSSLEPKVITIIQQHKLEFKIESTSDQKGKTKRVVFKGLTSSVSKATSEIQEEIINYQTTLAEQSGVRYPDEWEPQAHNLQLFPVVQGSSEWNHVVDNFNSTLPRAGVIGVTRIQNKWLWERYIQHKRRLDFKNNGLVNEKELFHGTRKNDPKLIYEGEDGFDMRFSRPGMWGLANYFAVNASYSETYVFTNADGSKSMFMARVLTGDSFQSPSDGNLRMPPEKPTAQSGNSQLSKVRYDSVNGTTHGSQVFMTYDNDKAYPAYLIRYHSYGL